MVDNCRPSQSILVMLAFIISPEPAEAQRFIILAEEGS